MCFFYRTGCMYLVRYVSFFLFFVLVLRTVASVCTAIIAGTHRVLRSATSHGLRRLARCGYRGHSCGFSVPFPGVQFLTRSCACLTIVIACVLGLTGPTCCWHDVGRVQRQGRRDALRAVHPPDTQSEAHRPGRAVQQCDVPSP